MKVVFVLAGFLFSFTRSAANDGVFKVNGNQLIPMYETDISVRKEILSIHSVNQRQAEISVYYEFFNPGEVKTLEVGFEAFSPNGDVDAAPILTRHPYIRQFTVSLNEQPLKWQVAAVNDSLYFQHGHYKTKPITALLPDNDWETAGFIYVYHFRANFAKGLNIVRHTYTVDLSSSISDLYSFDYVLTAATRWANHGIDDFTLQIDMGRFQDLAIDQTFFKNNLNWTMPAGAKSAVTKKFPTEEERRLATHFFLRKGMLVYHEAHFRPSAELHLSSQNYFPSSEDNTSRQNDVFDLREDELPFPTECRYLDNIDYADSTSKTVLLNLPYARRGYVFKNPVMKKYFTKMIWYLPDSAYRPNMSGLLPVEQEWLKKVRSLTDRK